MAINVDLSATDNPDKVGEFDRVLPGAAHLLVMEVKENGGKNGEHVVKFEVLMHSQQSEIGKTHTEYFPDTAEMAWKVLGFAYAAGIADREEMARQKAAGVQYTPIELSDAEGRQLFATFKQTDKNGKSYVNLDGLLSVTDPKAERHPRNAGMLKQLTGSTSGAAGATRPVTPQLPPAAASNPFAGVV